MEWQIGFVYLDLEAFAFNPLQNPLIQVIDARQKLAPPGSLRSMFDIGSGERIPDPWVPAIYPAEIG